MSNEPLPPGTVVVDAHTARTGVVMGAEGPYLQLRPLGGGREWDAHPAAVRPASAEERLRASLAAVNARSSGETSPPGPGRTATPPAPPPGRSRPMGG